MTERISLLAAALILWGCQGQAPRAEEGSGPAGAFAVAQVRFEQNATDGDVEAVFEVKGGDEGLTRLTVTAPDGRAVVDFSAPDASTLGIRQFRFESPEPEDSESLIAAYPEGVYTFAGVTESGDRLRGQSTLSHRLPPPTSFLRPGAEPGDFTAGHAEIEWEPVEGISAYIVYVERSDQSVTARLPGTATRFVVPDGFLIPGTRYQLGVGTVSGEGNISFVETMTTAGKEPGK